MYKRQPINIPEEKKKMERINEKKGYLVVTYSQHIFDLPRLLLYRTSLKCFNLCSDIEYVNYHNISWIIIQPKKELVWTVSEDVAFGFEFQKHNM